MTLNKRDTKKVIKSILELDVKSDNFFEIYKAVSEKYWTPGNDSSEFFKARSCVQKIAEKADSESVFIIINIMTQMLQMKKEGKKASKFVAKFSDDLSFTVDIYEDGIARDQLDELVKGASKAMEKGNIKLKKVEPDENDCDFPECKTCNESTEK